MINLLAKLVAIILMIICVVEILIGKPANIGIMAFAIFLYFIVELKEPLNGTGTKNKTKEHNVKTDVSAAVTWTEVDDLTCDIEDLRENPEKASEVANNFKDMAIRIWKDGVEKEEDK